MGGEIPTAWPMLPLEDVMEAIIDYRGKTPKKSTSGIPLITAKIVKAGRIEDPTEFIAEDLFDDWMVRGLPKRGDVVLTTEAPLGEVAQLSSDNVALAQRIVTLRGKSGLLDNDFLLYLLQSDLVQHQLQARSSGSTVKGIKQSELRKILLPIPPLLQQISIGKVLKSLDDKIEVNRAINRTLEAMAQAIFKSWFVDFDPVKAKMAARESGADPTRAAMAVISGKSDSELDAFQQQDPQSYEHLRNTAEAFPDALVDSELGMIPEGWGVGTLGDIASNVRDPVNPDLLDGDIPYVGLEHVERKHIYLTNWGRASDVESNKSRFREGDMLFGKLRPYFHKVCVVSFDGICSTDILVVRPKRPEWAGYLQCQLFEEPFVEHANLRSTGTRMPRAKWQDMAAYKLALPGKDLAVRFAEIELGLNKRARSNVDSSATLAELRDRLLPKLLNGDVGIV